VPDLVQRLRAAGCVHAEDEARLLTAASGDPTVVAALIERRVAGEPLEQVLGWAEFAGLPVAMAPGVFVPRRRTEFLVDVATAEGSGGSRGQRPVLVDLCCGSGALGLVLATRLDLAELHAADLEPAAVACAQVNVAPVGGVVHEGDLFDALPSRLRGQVDLLVANVPYVPTEALTMLPPEARDHEPRAALDGGADGLDLVRRVAAAAPGWLAAAGSVLVETGEEQAATAAAAFEAAGLVARIAAAPDESAYVVVAGRSALSAVPDKMLDMEAAVPPDLKDTLIRSLQHSREAVLWKLEGLGEYDVRRPLTPTGTNLLGLVKHLASVELRYFGDTFGRPHDEQLPWHADEADPNDDMWVTPGESRDDIVALYRRAWAHAAETFAVTDLDAPGRVPWWPPERADVNLHQILVRLSTETARHAGHADILRELIDQRAGQAADATNLPDDDYDWAAHLDRVEGSAREASGADAHPVPRRTVSP